MFATASPSLRVKSPARAIERTAMAASLAVAVLMAWQSFVLLDVLRAPVPVTPVAVAAPSANAAIEALFGGGDASMDALPSILLQASFVHSDPALSSAILVAGNAPGRLVGVGEDVVHGVQLAAVSADHVVLAKGGARLSIALRPAAPQ